MNEMEHLPFRMVYALYLSLTWGSQSSLVSAELYWKHAIKMVHGRFFTALITPWPFCFWVHRRLAYARNKDFVCVFSLVRFGKNVKSQHTTPTAFCIMYGKCSELNCTEKWASQPWPSNLYFRQIWVENAWASVYRSPTVKRKYIYGIKLKAMATVLLTHIYPIISDVMLQHPIKIQKFMQYLQTLQWMAAQQWTHHAFLLFLL